MTKGCSFLGLQNLRFLSGIAEQGWGWRISEQLLGMNRDYAHAEKQETP